MKYVLAIIILGILILVHEFGHFVLAKKNGILVKEFSIGLGPRLFSIKKGETRYSIKALPIGGSCIMYGGIDDPGEEEEDPDSEEAKERAKFLEGRSFNDKSVWARIAVLFAGPLFNFLLAFVLSMIVIGFVGYDPARIVAVDEKSSAYEAGLREGDIITKYNSNSIHFGREMFLEEYINPIDSEDDVIYLEFVRNGEKHSASFNADSYDKIALGISYQADSNEAKLYGVVEGSPMDAAGAKEDDVITSINGVEINSGADLHKYLEGFELNENESISMTLKRGSEEIQIDVKPTLLTYYSSGFAFNTAREKTSPIKVLEYSFWELEYQIETVYKSLVMLFTGHISPTELSGPVGIVDVIGDTYDEAASQGAFVVVMSLANITILLSANLGVMNLLPIPALDGGRLLFAFIELIRRKPISKEREGIVHFVGMVFLMALMVFIVVNDIKRW